MIRAFLFQGNAVKKDIENRGISNVNNVKEEINGEAYTNWHKFCVYQRQI
jgi:hypothetical protein